MENSESKVNLPEKAADCFPTVPVQGETKKKREGYEFVFADIVGSWAFTPETYVRMDGSEKKDILPGQFGFLIRWGCKGYGFGEYKVRFFTDGTIQVEDECSGPEFSKALFAYLGQQVAEKGEHDRQREAREKAEDSEYGVENPDVS